jgi:hypothetical protein
LNKSIDNPIDHETVFIVDPGRAEPLDIILARQNMIFGEYTFPVVAIYVNKTEVLERRDFEFKFENSGGYFCLSDGTLLSGLSS